MLVIGAFGKKISSAQKRWVESVEKRVGVTTQMLTSMKAIKMSGLSGYCSSLLQSLRHTELVISLAMRRFLTVGIGLCMFFPSPLPLKDVLYLISICNTDALPRRRLCGLRRSGLTPWRYIAGCEGLPSTGFI